MADLVRGQWYRGGTSKCWLFANDELPTDRAGIEASLIGAFGSGDARQVNGVGGGTSTTSKAAVISPSAIPGIDISYLFCQVGTRTRSVQFTSNCGNCASAIGLYALHNGLVKPMYGETAVRMLNENTRSIVQVVIPTPGSKVPEDGSVRIPGSDHPGVAVAVLFEDVDGGTTGELLPTGDSVTTLEVLGKAARMSCVDAGAPAVFIDSEDLGMTGVETTSEVEERLDDLVHIREQASVLMGLTKVDEIPSPAVPKVGIVGAPHDYWAVDGTYIRAADYDIAVRMVSMHEPHPAIGITSAVALARAVHIPGSIPSKFVGLDGMDRVHSEVRLGTPAGVIECRISRSESGAIERIGVERVARRIARAEIELPNKQ